ncbi:nucleotidyltransferase-like protein [Bacillus fonticola]|uniref:nucleotidyltransferase-like protein n=1 Tax=Bacillus fonticola TaxID=2728853 RepID=UPI001475BB46|nr:nucleotidyltransferase-like protein [Bacillus fonticola]
MEKLLRPIYQEKASHPCTMGIIMIEKDKNESPITDGFDAVLFVITNKGTQKTIEAKHYVMGEQKAALYIVSEEKMREWLLLGNNRKIFDWLYGGKVLFDRNEFLEELKAELRNFPFYGRKVKMGVEFAKLIRRYIDGKDFFENHHYLDAYNHIIHSLHHLARLSVIEKGFHPEVTVWKQVKQIEPEIYKLYEELVTSDETIDKRLELLFLASEYLIHSKLSLGAEHLVRVMDEQKEWTIQQFYEHTELQMYSVDLPVFLEYLVGRKMISIQQRESKGKGVFHRHYTTQIPEEV